MTQLLFFLPPLDHLRDVLTLLGELKLPGGAYSPHGLRHLAGAALAEAGATMDEVLAILGSLTEDEARGYVQQARRKVMARSVMDKWEAKGRTEGGG